MYDHLDNDCDPSTSEGSYYQLGDTGPGGGIVFYITDYGQHGYEVAPWVMHEDQTPDYDWGCQGTQSGERTEKPNRTWTGYHNADRRSIRTGLAESGDEGPQLWWRRRHRSGRMVFAK